jgi:hypothetical protein
MRTTLAAVLVLTACVDVEHEPPELGRTSSALQVCGTSLQAAIDAAPQDAMLEICAGTYRERLVIDGKRIELRGVSGAGATIVDADAGGRVLVVRNSTGTGVTIRGLTLKDGSTSSTGGGISCVSSTLKVRDSVVTANRATGGGGLAATGCVLDVARSRFDANNAGSGRGGGAFVTGGSGVIIDNTFNSNNAEEGGGIAIVGGTTELADNEVRDNSAHRGGGLFVAHDGLVRGNQIIANEGRWTGGGIYTDAPAPTIEGNTIDHNTSVNDGGGFYVHQGAPHIVDNVITANESGDDGGGVRLFESSARVERNVIENNVAADSGGGVRVSHVQAQLIDNIIRNNQAPLGGGLDLDNDASVLRGGVISGNRASSGGGISAALYPWSGAVIEDVEIADNVATSRGGGMYIVNNDKPVALRHLVVRGNRAPQGAGLYIKDTSHTLTNSVFDRNIATGEGGAMYLAAGSSARTAAHAFVVTRGNSASTGSSVWSAAPNVSLANSIFAEGSGTAIKVSVVPTFRFNDTWPRSFSGMTDPTGSSGNISADPRFIAPSSGNFGLGSGSPAIDAGDPALHDADGSRADMGLFGGPDGDTPPTPPPPPPPGTGPVLEADAHVALDQPAANFGGATTIASDTSPMTEAYLRFRVSGTSGVTGARLQLTVTNGTGDAPALYAAASTWSEDTITWNNRPARGALIADRGAVAAGTVVEYDVSSLVTGDGVFTMALVPTSSDGFAAYAREGTTAPRLVLTTGGGTGPTAELEADTYAAAAAPDAAHGSEVLVTSDTSPLEEGYLRFRVTGATTITSARVRVVVVDASSDGPAVHTAASDWEESTLTWNHRPARSGSALDDVGAAAIGDVVEYDVTGAITGDGVYTFALVPTSSSGFAVSSREGSSPPQLVIE